MEDFFYIIAKGIELVSFTVMVYGGIIAAFLFIKNEFKRFTGNYNLETLNKIRLDFGYYILLGLEFLIAADIIETILKPNTEELIELGGIVIIRIVMSYFLTKEITAFKSPHQNNSGS